MAGLIKRSFAQPEEVRPFVDGKGQMEVHHLDGAMVGRATFQPGWRWSEHVRPIAGTDSCQANHVGYFVSGRMRIRMDDGSEEEFGAGDLMVCPPGHDAWVVGDEACVAVDWAGYADYAKPAPDREHATA